MSERIQFGLVDNALDFVLSAAEHARRDSARDWKYALLHLVAGVELLLKARLGQEHWSLLFADKDKADRNALESGDFTSVDFKTACTRLAQIATVEIDKSALHDLKELRKLRHRIQHFGIDVEVEQVRSLMAKGTNFFVDAVRAYMTPHISTEQEESLEAIHEHLGHFREFVRERLATIEPELEGHALGACPRCWQWTVIIGEGKTECAFCGYETDPFELAESMGEGSMDGECLICGEETLAFVLYNNDDGACHCTTCGNVQRVCLSCRKHFIGDGDFCPDCPPKTTEEVVKDFFASLKK